MTVLRRHTGAAILAIAGSLALLGQTVSAQSNICYPKANKRSPLKKGPCFMVSHTFATFLGLDHPAALDPLHNDFILVDRQSGDPISPACKRTKVYVSTDATDVDLGHFKRQNWATQAMTLVEGKLQVDHEAIEANLAATQNRKGDKHSTTTELETIFMVQFECPSSPGASEGKWRTKQSRNSIFRAALRYVPNPGEINAANFYRKFFQHLLDLHGRTVETSIQANNSVSSSSSDVLAAAVPLSDTPPEFWFGDIIHNPTCFFYNLLEQKVFCDVFAGIQELALTTSTFGVELSLPNCLGVYPDYMQGLVDQSKGLGTDKRGNVLPGTLDDVRVDGYLPDQVDWDTIKREKATLFWLFDKTQQLGPWAVCDDGSVNYELEGVFAPNFGPTTLYYMHNYHEYPASVYFENGFSTGSNLTETAIAQSAVGPDAAGKKTFVLAFRGTRARSEWISDLQYNQVHVDQQTLADHPFLLPFEGMAIHEGFAEIFEQVWVDIRDEVLVADPDRIIVTGHSLGGGMASLLAYALAWELENTPIQVDAALFAPPTAGDANFADAFNRYVNGRRVAYVTHQPGSVGDIVPQLMCPDQYVCEYSSTLLDVPVRTMFPSSGDLRNVVQYTTVGGNVLFDYRHFPDAPAEYVQKGLPVDIIRDTWLALDDANFELNAHICSYGCFLSSEVDAPLNKCFMKPKDDNSFRDPDKVLPLLVDGMTIGQIKQKLPPNVQQYGLCE